MTERVFIGVAWPYVNGEIHVGHVGGALLPADLAARFYRMRGAEVLMVSGSDCFGTPITVEADKRKIAPRELVEEYHPKVKALFEALGLTFDLYTMTMTENHERVVQEIFLTLLKKGYITKGSSRQYYSANENKFLPDRYVEGKCGVCGAEKARSDECDSCGTFLAEGQLINPVSAATGSPVELKESSHYFFDWGKLEPFLKEYTASHKSEWREWVNRETEKWLKEGLKPRAITRDLEWGVPIPADRIPDELKIEGLEHKRIYVWFDAVIGYLSAPQEWSAIHGKPWEPFWYEKDTRHLYFMGKDNLVFHTLMWPGMIRAFDEELKLPDIVAVNQFFTLAGKKFSKSRGVSLNPQEAADRFGLDSLRFYVTSILPEESDADFTQEGFLDTTRGVLAAKIGNFVNRNLKLAGEDFKASGDALSTPVVEKIESTFRTVSSLYEQAKFRRALDETVRLAEFANLYITEKQPWKMRKEGRTEEAGNVLSECLALNCALAILLSPVTPNLSRRIGEMMSVDFVRWPDSSEVVSHLKELLPQVAIRDPQPLVRVEE